MGKESHGQKYRRTSENFIEVIQKELLVYFRGYTKNDFKELRIMIKEISRKSWISFN
jgi:hypothetical protein